MAIFSSYKATKSSPCSPRLQKSRAQQRRPNTAKNNNKRKKRKRKYRRDFPGGPVVKNPPYNAGEAGSTPGQGTKILYAAGQLSLCAATTEPACLKERAHVPQTTEPTCSGACVPQLEKRKPTRRN